MVYRAWIARSHYTPGKFLTIGWIGHGETDLAEMGLAPLRDLGAYPFEDETAAVDHYWETEPEITDIVYLWLHLQPSA